MTDKIASQPDTTTGSGKEFPRLPVELWSQIVSYLPYRDICLTIKPLCRTLYHLASNERLHGLLPHIWEQIFSHISYRDNFQIIRRVCTSFNHTILNPSTPSLQHQLWNSPPISLPVAAGLPLDLHITSEVALGNAMIADFLPTEQSFLSYRFEHIGTLFRSSFCDCHFVNDDWCYPAIPRAKLRLFDVAEITVVSSRLPSRGLSVRDVVKAFFELLHAPRSKATIIEFLRHASCQAMLPEDHDRWFIKAKNWKSHPADKGVVIAPKDDMPIIEYTKLYQSEWSWEWFYPEIGEDGEVTFVMAGWDIHVECGKDCASRPEAEWVEWAEPGGSTPWSVISR